MANSTAIVTDLATVAANISTQQRTRANAAAGPIADVDALIQSLSLRAQEMKEILAYLLGSSQVYGTTGGIFQTGDTNAAQGYTLLVNVANDLT